MDRSTGRKRRRKKVEYDDVVPSTDLPPLVEGELRCFIFVTIGKLLWGSTTPSRAPPASPAYIRLRWWGEASDGTFFRPQNNRDDKTVKSRAQFCIRSGPKQMAAYFNDMGSVTFDVLSSPTSLPIGRVQVPGVAGLSSSHPIRGFFPIISASSRKLGELQISVSFKSIRGAYDDSSDNVTDGSLSSRSRNTSLRGRNSRSRASSVSSARSRSSSRGSYRQTRGRSHSNSSNASSRRRSSSQSRAKKLPRSRSRSNDSKASHASRNSKRGSESNNVPPSADISTPRGIDALLEENGHNLYSLTKDRLNDRKNPVQIKTTVSSTKPTESVHFDAISELLKRGRKLRDDISQSALPTHSHPTSSLQKPNQPMHYQPPVAQQIPKQEPSPQPYQMPPSLPSIITARQPKADTEMRIVDMVLKAKGLRNDTMHLTDVSTVSSPLGSFVSELEDPLHDESILQHLFYDHLGVPSINPSLPMQVNTSQSDIRTKQNQPVQCSTHISGANREYKDEQIIRQPVTSLSGHTQEKLSKLGSINLARISIHALQVNSSLDSEDENGKNRFQKKSSQAKWKKAKPPVPSSPTRNKNTGTFFVEYKFPSGTSKQRPTATTSSSQELTRVASRKTSPGGLVKFDQHSVFPVRFNTATVNQWCADSLELVVYHRKPKDKKPSVIGEATIPLRFVIDDECLCFSDSVDVIRRNYDASTNSKHCGSIKVSIELTSDSKDLPMQMSPVKKPAPVRNPTAYTVTKTLSYASDNEEDRVLPNEKILVQETVPKSFDGPRVCIASDPVTHMSCENEVCPRVASTVLYLYIFLKEARDIPATRLQSGADVCKSCAPNVYLLCRTFASDDVSKTGVIWSTSNPKFDFSQVIPVKIDNHLFTRMRDNFMVVEVWTKIPSASKFTDKLMGLVKVPLHLFYQSLKDPEIARAVLKSHYPLISVDGFQPIVDLFTGHERGKLQLLLALGTQTQVNALRKVKEYDDGRKKFEDHHLDDAMSPEVTVVHTGGPVQHSFNLTVHGLRGFKPQNNQVWGETDCFIQYNFPTQRMLKDEETDSQEDSTTDEDSLDLASMQSYRTDTTLCVPDPQFNYTRKHNFQPPASVQVQRIVLSTCSGVGKYPGGGIPFEVWSRYYYPNVRDQLLAKGSLPAAKLCALVTMNKRKAAEQTFHVPMEFVDPEPGSKSAGDLGLSVKYKTSGSTLESAQPPLQFCKNVKLQVAVLRACGLKPAAKLASSLVTDSDLEYCSEVGVNSYAVIKTSFLPDESCRETRCVARSFTPDYNHQFELSCPVVSYHNSVTPVSLAELLSSGEIELEIWHKPAPDDNIGKSKSAKDILLGRVKIPTCDLLTRTTGCSGWFSITSLESLKNKTMSNVGAVELSVSLACGEDLDLLLRAAKAVTWKPSAKSDLNHLLVPDTSGVLKPIDKPDVNDDFVTACITITNAWLPRHAVMRSGVEEIDKRAHIYVRYKFFDRDSVTSSVCPVLGQSGRKSFKDHSVVPVKLAHRKSFLCKASQPFVWYLREEMLELQIWLSHSRSSSRSNKRPSDSDKLLGSAYINTSSVLVGGLHKQQHISGLFPLFKAGVDDLGDASVRVYLSLNPGDHTKPYDFESLDDTSATLSSSTDNVAMNGNELDLTNVDGDETDVKRLAHDDQMSFSAVVSVERAMHLPPMSPLPVLSSTDESSGKVGRRPSCFVSYPVVDGSSKSMAATKVVSHSSCPVWEDAKEVKLDTKLLHKNGGNLLFRVWHRDDDLEELKTSDDSPGAQSPCDRMIGFATVDVSILNSGFRAVNGWYNILDIHGNCQGQMKVAVTPTEPICIAMYQNPSIPHEARIQEDGKNKGILHSVPLLGPVETPSGSMYYPGVKSSAQTVGSTCRMSEHVTAPSQSSPVVGDKQTTKTSPGNANINAVPSIPSRTLFRYDQQTCLMSTLQRQMKELDVIKKNFEQKRCDVSYTTSSNIIPETKSYFMQPTPSLTKSYEIQASKSDAQTYTTSLISSSAAILSTAVTNPMSNFNVDLATDQQNSELLSKLTYSTPGSNTSKPTIHMSLFNAGKGNFEDYDDGAALSDNELSDVEFVCPRNLNEQSAIYTDNLHSDVNDANLVGSAADNITELDASLGSMQPNKTSTDASELNNTSLWLSASTSRMGDLSGDANDQDSDDDGPGNLPLASAGVTVLKIRKKDVVLTDPFVASSKDFESTREESMIPVDADQENDAEDPISVTEVSDEEPVSELDDTVEIDTKDSPPLSEHEESIIQTDEEEVNDGKRTGDRNDDEEGNEVVSEHDEEDVMVSDKEDATLQEGAEVLNDVASTGHISSHSSGSSSEEHHSSLDSVSLPGSIQEVVTGLEDVTDLPTSNLNAVNTDSSNCASNVVASTSAPNPRSGKSQVPSFFPPRQDLVASMRALQAITTEQQHKLHNQGVDEDKENSREPSIPTTSKTRKKLSRPSSFTVEQTKRLARIFNTKYTSG